MYRIMTYIMQKKISTLICGVIVLCVALFGTTSCSTPKNITYFQDTTPETIINMASEQPIKARPGDKVLIIVHAKDPAVSAMFNLPTYSNRVDEAGIYAGSITNQKTIVGTTSGGISPYTIDPEGNIDFPILGKLHIEGMTRNEIAGFVKGELMGRDLIKNPTVNVDFMNVGVNILGHVSRPGRYAINSDKFSITDALAMAGDVPLSGQRQNIKVIRKEDGKAKTYVIDLTNAQQTMGSPAYYLRQDDIIYVEPNDMQKRNTVANGNQFLNVGFWISFASLLTTVATTIGVFVKK